jgi:hypothetical protein
VTHVAHDGTRPSAIGQELPVVRETLSPSTLADGEYSLLLSATESQLVPSGK